MGLVKGDISNKNVPTFCHCQCPEGEDILFCFITQTAVSRTQTQRAIKRSLSDEVTGLHQLVFSLPRHQFVFYMFNHAVLVYFYLYLSVFMNDKLDQLSLSIS
ncbi:hypothetical protein XENOCAPTIV_014180 [Xenoophorus captivus]|uniref:Uncharacterized protein n=1 Tax=Xenoophorus captivus TaxID=1517983 RepID=A0ABV0S9B3_9TELE